MIRIERLLSNILLGKFLVCVYAKNPIKVNFNINPSRVLVFDLAKFIFCVGLNRGFFSKPL